MNTVRTIKTFDNLAEAKKYGIARADRILKRYGYDWNNLPERYENIDHVYIETDKLTKDKRSDRIFGNGVLTYGYIFNWRKKRWMIPKTWTDWNYNG